MYEEKKKEYSPILPGATHILSSSGIDLEKGLSSSTTINHSDLHCHKTHLKSFVFNYYYFDFIGFSRNMQYHSCVHRFPKNVNNAF